MAVPAGDERDYKFAKHFDLPIIHIFKDKDLSEAAFVEKEGFELQNSDVLKGLGYQEATDKIIALLEEKEKLTSVCAMPYFLVSVIGENLFRPITKTEFRI